MVKTFKDLTGLKFGRLTVVNQTNDYVTPAGIHNAQWTCDCDCGNKNIIVRGSSLSSGHSKSCGCIKKEIASKLQCNLNTYECVGDYTIGYTNKGEPFWVDNDDVERVKNFCWTYDNKTGYLETKYCEKTNNDNIWKNIRLHTFIMMGNDKSVNPDGLMVDHINHLSVPQHKVDNRKSNLRFVNIVQNSQNRARGKNNTSGIVGVCFCKSRNKWEAYIKANKKNIHLGRFLCLEDAVKARKEAEIKYFGKYRYDSKDVDKIKNLFQNS